MAPEEGAADPSITHIHRDILSKEGAAVPARRREDDELTSLSWLQDKNLLKGIKFRGNSKEVIGDEGENAVVSSQTVTADEGEEDQGETNHQQADSVQHATQNQPQQQQQQQQQQQTKQHPHHIPYNPKVHTRWKPPYSFSCLIFMSIENSTLKALPVKEIYAWILDHFPYYRTAPLGWKNSVRHNLSLNKCFKKVDKPSNLGKGSLWTVEPKYRINLMQALMKAPAPNHPYTPTQPSYRLSNELEWSGKDDDSDKMCSSDEIDDVDAARAMLALKHGAASNCIGRKEKTSASSLRNEAGPDHSYTAATLTPYRGVEDAEELRKTVEGADALLNLAGIKTPDPPAPVEARTVITEVERCIVETRAYGGGGTGAKRRRIS